MLLLGLLEVPLDSLLVQSLSLDLVQCVFYLGLLFLYLALVVVDSEVFLLEFLVIEVSHVVQSAL